MISRIMAIVKANYTKSTGAAKAAIRYMQHRKGKEGEKTSRALFGNDGLIGRYEAYRMIDEAETRSHFFRIVISPDVKTEDTKRDLSLREITERTMHALEQQLHTPILWVAAIHADHTDKRHVHALAIAKERLLPVQAMRQTATQAALAQRKERDLLFEQKRETREEGRQWERQR